MSPTPNPAAISGAKIFGMLLLFVLIGFPMVAYLWDSINSLLAGELRRERLLISVPLLLLFALYLRFLARFLQRFETN